MLQVKKRPLTHISQAEWTRRMQVRVTWLKRAAWVAGVFLVVYITSGAY